MYDELPIEMPDVPARIYSVAVTFSIPGVAVQDHNVIHEESGMGIEHYEAAPSDGFESYEWRTLDFFDKMKLLTVHEVSGEVLSRYKTCIHFDDLVFPDIRVPLIKARELSVFTMEPRDDRPEVTQRVIDMIAKCRLLRGNVIREIATAGVTMELAPEQLYTRFLLFYNAAKDCKDYVTAVMTPAALAHYMLKRASE